MKQQTIEVVLFSQCFYYCLTTNTISIQETKFKLLKYHFLQILSAKETLCIIHGHEGYPTGS